MFTTVNIAMTCEQSGLTF